MKTSEFDYKLPETQIAQYPHESRGNSRMMVINRSAQTFSHHQFSDLPNYLNAGDLLVLNDTEVLKARIRGRKAETGGKVEALLVEELESGLWQALLKSSRRPALGASLRFGEADLAATFEANGEGGTCLLRFAEPAQVSQLMEQEGELPLPPYIHRENEAEDFTRYQTVYAQHGGAVAAPTAGLHFSREMLDGLQDSGVRSTAVTLHVGLGTFKPVDVEDPADHIMHSERIMVSEQAAREIRETRAGQGRVITVGSTALRSLESLAAIQGEVAAWEGRSELFIRPPYDFQLTDGLLTNFHLPRSTLIMMVCAFAGYELTMNAYHAAVKEGYRFFSYGDCMLVI